MYSWDLLTVAIMFFAGVAMWRHHERRLWLQQRQWKREDREAQMNYERQRMQEALRTLHEPFEPMNGP